MVDPRLARRRLEALMEYVEALDGFREVSREAFESDPSTHYLAEHYLQLAVQAAIDLAFHLLSDAGLRGPESYRDAFTSLATSGVIDGQLGHRLAAAAGMRNILVHDYLDVDHGLIHDAIPDAVADLRAFAAVVAARLPSLR